MVLPPTFALADVLVDGVKTGLLLFNPGLLDVDVEANGVVTDLLFCSM